MTGTATLGLIPLPVHVHASGAGTWLFDGTLSNELDPSLGHPERYVLSVGDDGVRIRGSTGEALFRGATTLQQLADACAGQLPHLEIDDSPRFSWRGLSLDVVRTFFTVDQVKRIIDQLARFKCNVLHLHLSDHEGWRLEIRSWPDLTAIGGRGARKDRPGGWYSQDDYRELVRYAAERFVTIVPEIDMPGHCTAALAAYPELRGRVEPGEFAGVPHAVLDPDLAATPRFVRDVIGELAELTPGSWLHIGGDEAFGITDDAYRRFVTFARQVVADAGKRCIGWQETARASLSSDQLVQYWIHLPDLPTDAPPAIVRLFDAAEGDLAAATGAGARVIASPLAFAYLDQPYTEPGPDEQEERRRRLGPRAYPGTSLRSAVDWDPLALAPTLTHDAQLAGVEAAMWCETVTDFDDLQFLLQPRLAGVAERAWSQQDTFDWPDYRTRLAHQAPRWRSEGWNFFRGASVDWR